jgi:hypothetical protein
MTDQVRLHSGPTVDKIAVDESNASRESSWSLQPRGVLGLKCVHVRCQKHGVFHIVTPKFRPCDESELIKVHERANQLNSFHKLSSRRGGGMAREES